MGKRERKYADAAVATPTASHMFMQTRLATTASFFALLLTVMFALTNITIVQAQTPSSSEKPKNKADVDANVSAPPVPWNKVPDAEKRVLAPLEKEWKDLPGQQHRKLIGAAKEYPKLKPIEQERFQERLRGWSSLTSDQRKTAREKFQSLNNLAPEKQQEVKARWNEKKAASASAPTPAPADSALPVPPSSK